MRPPVSIIVPAVVVVHAVLIALLTQSADGLNVALIISSCAVAGALGFGLYRFVDKQEPPKPEKVDPPEKPRKDHARQILTHATDMLAALDRSSNYLIVNQA